ncbi:MAG: hypothetical protein MJ188_05185 [Treponema sp.]|nr:hypothetical protein [Treponema sp.]
MAQDVLTIAWKFMRKRKFATAIKMLEGRSETYDDNFEYYLMLGTACLYVGDIGSSVSYFQKARNIKLVDTRLLLGQAAIFLRRGDTERALQYYMEIRGNDPANRTAKDAIEFIRTRGDYDTICRWVDTGRIEQFYPPLGANPDVVAGIIIPLVACVVGCSLVFAMLSRKNAVESSVRGEIGQLVLSAEDKNNLHEKDMSGQSYGYILTDKQISEAYANALNYFQSKRDNAAQVEINRILNSNASVAIKQKAQVLMSYLEDPTFDTLSDNPDYLTVEAEPALYMDCWVAWGGKISNAVLNPDGSYSCQLLVGYETGELVEGIVSVRFDAAPNIAPDQPVKILGKLSLRQDDRKIFLKGRAVYQKVHDGFLIE